MKKVALAFAGLLLATTVVHAEMEGYRQVPQTELAKYKEAIAAATPKNLKISEGCYADEIVAQAGAIYIQDSSAQPLVVAILKQGGKRYTAVMTSDAQFKTIISIRQDVTTFSTTRVNHGDLRTPVMVEDTVGTTVSKACGELQP